MLSSPVAIIYDAHTSGYCQTMDFNLNGSTDVPGCCMGDIFEWPFTSASAMIDALT